MGWICMVDDGLARPCMGAVGVSLLCLVCGARWFCCLLWLFVLVVTGFPDVFNSFYING